MFDLKAVQLQDEPAILYQLLIVPAAVSPAAVQQTLIPPATRFDIRDTDERLGAHCSYPNRTAALAISRAQDPKVIATPVDFPRPPSTYQ
jgi:hypothetical protein